MWTNKIKLWRFTLCILLTVGTLASVVKGDDEVPSETQCRPYIEKALKEHHVGDSDLGSLEENESNEVFGGDETNKESEEEGTAEIADDDDNDTQESKVDDDDDDDETEPSVEVADEPYVGQESVEGLGDGKENSEEGDDNESNEETGKSANDDSSEEDVDMDKDESKEAEDTQNEDDSKEDPSLEEDTAEQGSDETQGDSKEEDGNETIELNDTADEESDEKTDETPDQEESDAKDSDEENDDDGQDGADDKSEDNSSEKDDASDNGGHPDSEDQSVEDNDDKNASFDENDDSKGDEKSEQDDSDEKESVDNDDGDEKEDSNAKDDAEDDGSDESKDDSDESAPEEELLLEKEIPENLRSREHIDQILKLNEDSSEAELTVERAADIILRDLKKLYENNIKPLENLYKYRDLSNRHFGDPEIFSKPLILFMGPWSGGKSSILNYLTGLEFTDWALRTGAEPSPAYFNILMHGKEPEVLDGTQMAADWTFSGLQKFGQGLEERLRGLKYPSKLLEKVNIVEIPGILEVRKQVSRVFPFNDACQWFIDRADIIFLVYDPSKLDVGPETEAILDQLKGRESQTRIVLNKADNVKPEELLRVQSALIWNISPLMSSPQPPVMYTVSLWSLPYEQGAPTRLLQAQERDLLKDLRTAVDRRIENKIGSARRFAVRVRNHAKMVDCYLTTYYNHKTIFGNRKLIADSIIENPQNYHIYEGLSTLTNISRYDLPDPETYRDFFRLNPLYEFQQLSATCTYFRGCPINKLDVAIAYDLPDLVGKYKKMVENVTPQGMPQS